MRLIEEFVNEIPINRDDVVLFSSDTLKLCTFFFRNNEKIDLNIFINLLLDKLGPNGTMLFPTYNWGFCRGETFDYKTTVSKTGVLSNLALKHPAFRRTKHPIYSWAVTGKDRDYLCALENTDSFGKDSPFEYLYEKKGKNILLDVSLQQSFTFTHFVEQCVGVPYRYIKRFTAEYIDENGEKTERTYSMYVRDYSLDAKANLDPMEKQLIDKGLVKVTNFGNSRILNVPLDMVFDEIKEDIVNNQAKKIALYKGQCV